MEISRQTIAKALVAVFILNLIVMGVGAFYSSQQVPPISQEVVSPDGDVLDTDREHE